MRFFISVIMILAGISLATAQGKYFTKKGNINFSSNAPLEKIEAENNTATFVMDTESGNVQVAVLIKAFHFEKALMQEHFNENYMESDKFPKATFKGSIKDYESLNFQEEGQLEVQLAGQFTIHGITKEVEIPATFQVNGENISGSTEFSVLNEDYGIDIPKVVRDNIAKEVAISIDVQLEKLKE